MTMADKGTNTEERTIGFIDDEDDFLDDLKQEVSEKLNYKAYYSSEIHQAVHWAEKRQIDTLVSDYKMSSLDGIQLLSTIRKMNSNIDLILLTGLVLNEREKEKCREMEINILFKDDGFENVMENIRTIPRKSGEKNYLYANDEDISLEGKSLESPPTKAFSKGKDAVKKYFNSLSGKQALNEVKVLLVGEGYSGKTSLANALRGKPFNINESQTHGINIDALNIPQNKSNIKVRLWDFGGQEIMRATHQFFLSKRSLYILVLDSRKDERAEYWLNHIKSFGGNSPVMIVFNKIDQNPGFDLNRSALKEKYPNIIDFYPLSCASGVGMESFSNQLNQAVGSVQIKSARWGSAWFKVKEQVENREDDFISYKEYRQICKEAKVPDNVSRETLLEYLNDLGVIIHFKDLELNDTHILKPRWITEAVYKIINSPQLAKGKGILALDQLPDILKKRRAEDFYYSPGKYRFIISLMRKFQLCYQFGEDHVLVPDLLDANQPDFKFDYDGALGFIAQYDFLPPSVMPRFIVNMHTDIHNGLQWRTGVVLWASEYSSTAVVKADIQSKCISIHVNGPQKRDYFTVLLIMLQRMNNDFQKLKITELEPMTNEPDIHADNKQLIRYLQNGNSVILPGGSSDEKYKVNDSPVTIAIGKRSDEEFLKLLKEALRKEDSEKSTLEKDKNTLMDVVSFEPTFLGFKLNVNAIIKKFRRKKKKTK
jgi:internalin A